MRGLKTRTDGQWKRVAIFTALFLIFIFVLNGVKNVYQKKQEAQKILVQMTEEEENLKNRKQFLEESLQKLQTIEGLKFEIRKKLNVAEVGESVALIVEEEPADTSIPLKKSAWQQLKDALKDLCFFCTQDTL